MNRPFSIDNFEGGGIDSDWIDEVNAPGRSPQNPRGMNTIEY